MRAPAPQVDARQREFAFERLHRRHRRAVYGLALRDLRDPDEAEDITQVTFLNAYRALWRGDAPESPRAWLLAIARDVCRRRYRARALRPLEVELRADLSYMRKTPKVVSGIGAFRLAEIPSASTRRVSSGSRMPSSQSRAVE
jgi:DNA-directed RNA polymerase specialized sigma24 family protein